MWRGEHPERPYVLLAQQSLFDPSRAPVGQHTVWAYCHVPNASTVDMTERIEAQIERFAPGFRGSRPGAKRARAGPARGLQREPGRRRRRRRRDGPRQLFTAPVVSLTPYRTPVPGLYLCSSSTPPGGGVHGMCGYHAARTAVRDLGRLGS